MPTKKTSAAQLTEFDPAEHLQDEADIAEYLTQVIQDGDASELAHALGILARARGMAEIAKAAGLSREALYKALRPDAQPRFETVQRVCTALGVKLAALPQIGG
jgi:probable addiction module antidote protein